MTPLEKAEINRLPDRYKPIGTLGYLLYSLLFILPIVGIVFLILFSISDKNVNRRSFSRCFLICYISVIVVVAVFAILIMTKVIPLEFLDRIKELQK